MPSDTPSTHLASLKALQVKSLWSRTRKQPWSFLLTSAFLFLEYVRPASAYGFESIPLSQLTLTLAFLACVLEGRSSFRVRWGWALLLIFTLTILASSIAAVYPDISYSNLNLWISWLLVIYVLSSSTDSEEKMLLMLVGYFLWNFKMSQHSVRSWASAGFAFRDWGVTGAPGWFANSGEFAIQMCVFLPMVVYFWAALRPSISKLKQAAIAGIAVSALIGIVASSSRGAVLGVAAVGLFIILWSSHRLWGISAVTALSALVWVILPPEQKARFDSAGTDGTSMNRLTYWADGIDIANDYPLLGIGYKNWLPYYKQFYLPKGALPHNIFIEAWAELGYVGLAAFLMLVGYTLMQNWQTRRLTHEKGVNPNRFLYYISFGLDGALVGYLVSGFFVTVLYYPYFWVNFAFTIALANIASGSSPKTALRAARRRERAHPARFYSSNGSKT